MWNEARIARVAWLVTGLLLLIPAESHAAVGRTAADATVSLTGEAGYTIPIVAPPGAKGLSPELALVYKHNLKESIAGVGWAIGGLSAISRCPGSWAQNGGPAEVELEVGDRYCLDGNQLRLTGGTYGLNGSTYRLELDNGSKVVASGTAGNGPAYFTVYKVNGLIYEYGNTADSRVESLAPAYLSTARTWALNRIRDREGNSIDFVYDEDGAPDGNFRIASVSYGGNAGAGLPAQFSVTFTYEAQPAADVDSEYSSGGRKDDKDRLTQIEVSHLATATRVRRYILTYVNAPVTARSRVSQIQECAGTTLDCLPATTFTYQDGTAGFGSAVSTGTTVNGPMAIDINGDGRTDIVYSTTATSGTGFWAYRLANSSGGYAAAVTTTYANTNFAASIAIDYNSDGRDDVMVPQSGSTWWVLQGTATGLSASVNTGAPYASTNDSIAYDYDGDGRDDLVYGDSVAPQLLVRLRLAGGGFSSTTINAWSVGIAFTGLGAQNAKGKVRGVDVNGDGRRDIFIRTYMPCYLTVCPYDYIILGGSQGAWIGGSGATSSVKGIDINGDGYTDLVGGESGILAWQLSSGKGFAGSGGGLSIAGFDFARSVVVDYDGDGFEDLLLPSTTLGVWFLSRSTGTGLSTFSNTGISTGSPTATFAIDANGDGLDDIGYVTSAGVYGHLPHAGIKPDLLKRAADGFGNYAEFSYIPLTQTGYTRGTTAVYPQQDYQGPVYVARTVTASNGIGSTYVLTYSYAGAQLNLQGRGLTGFTSRTVVDSRNSVSVTETYRHDFPFIGALVQRDMNQSGGTLMHRIANTWTPVNGAGTETYKLPYISQSVETQKEVGGTYNGNTIRTITTSTVVDAYGSPTDVTTTTVEPATGANGVQAGASYSQRIVHSLPADNTTNWCVSRPTQTEFINSHNQTYGGSTTRTVTRTWDVSTYCRVTQEVTEPSNATYKVTRGLDYDSFGNVDSETITGNGMLPRTTTTYWGTTGQFPSTVTNPLSQTTTFVWDLAKGVKTSETDPNGIPSSWQYDVFGRKTRDVRPDGTYTHSTPNDCNAGNTYCGTSDSTMRVLVEHRTYTPGAVQIRLDQTYLDIFGRTRVVTGELPGTTVSKTRTTYDALGRVAQRSMPYDNGGTIYWTTTTYDLLNRPTQISRPISQSDLTNQIMTIEYLGLTTRTVDFEGKESKKVANAVGAVARSVDHAAYHQSFDYDAFGSLKRVQDSLANTLFQASYAYGIDALRTQTIDMNMGTWNYTLNPLGEVSSFTDALGQPNSFTYDKLSRPLTRTERALTTNTTNETTTWTWGTSAAAWNIGQLQSVSGPGYSESYLFDNKGRLSQKTIVSDATYLYNYTYSTTTGLLETVQYPTSTASYRLKLQFAYDKGIQTQISDFAVPATVFWARNTTNSWGQITQETLANGLKVNRSFDLISGFLNSIQTGPTGNPTQRQNVGYLWDKVGHLEQRQDNNQGLTESFYYDNLHRLDYSQLKVGTGAWTTNLDLAYDAMGNITAKTSATTPEENVGTGWAYDPIKKHQVKTAGAHTFTYDANGNMLTGRGATMTWKGFNYPNTITKGALTTQFYYAPDRSYWKQVAAYSTGTETSIYIGGLLEKVTTAAGTDWRHSIPTPGAGAALYIRKSSGTNLTYSVSGDHLGSTSMITDSTQSVVANESYGAFGQRRGSNWQGVPSAAEWNAINGTTRRGYTGHTMVDNLNLIHMNGRMYDPVIGRMLSADPYVPDPGMTQSYNRYSYVYNNPLSYTDPSGFVGVIEAWQACNASFLCRSFLASFFGSLFGGSKPPPPPKGCYVTNPVLCTGVPGATRTPGWNPALGLTPSIPVECPFGIQCSASTPVVGKYVEELIAVLKITRNREMLFVRLKKRGVDVITFEPTNSYQGSAQNRSGTLSVNLPITEMRSGRYGDLEQALVLGHELYHGGQHEVSGAETTFTSVGAQADREVEAYEWQVRAAERGGVRTESAYISMMRRRIRYYRSLVELCAQKEPECVEQTAGDRTRFLEYSDENERTLERLLKSRQ